MSRGRPVKFIIIPYSGGGLAHTCGGGEESYSIILQVKERKRAREKMQDAARQERLLVVEREKNEKARAWEQQQRERAAGASTPAP